MPVFSSAPWQFLALAAAGLGLTWMLYRRRSTPLRTGPRRVLTVLSAVAWLGLAGLLAQPIWENTQVTYHPPTAVLAVDRSGSFAGGTALGAEAAVRRSLAAVRGHYARLGFHIRELDFAETAAPAGGGRHLGVLSDLGSLRRYLDSADIANLQGVFLWSDGRFNLDTESDLEASWPAPVFPVAMAPASAEVQGERVELDWDTPDSGAVGTVAWRPAGRAAGKAELELKAGERVVWRETLPHPDVYTGAAVQREFHLPAAAARQAAAAASLQALVRPERESDNVTAANDTVPLLERGRAAGHFWFVRPLQSLEERGLIDALFATETMPVATLAPDSLAARSWNESDMLWVRAGAAAETAALRAAVAAAIPAVVYTLPGTKAPGAAVFSGDARVVWSEAATGILPAGVVRLADLGSGDWDLATGDAAVTPIAWAEEHGRRGLLFAVDTAVDTAAETAVDGQAAAPVFRLADPPLWSVSFRDQPDPRVASLQRQWVAGVTEWIRRHRHRLQVRRPGVLLAHRPFWLTAVSASATPAAERGWELRLGSPARRIAATPGPDGAMRFGPLDLPAGAVPATLVAAGRTLWHDTLVVRSAEALEQARIGVDVEALTRIASVTQGEVVRDFSDSGGGAECIRALPELPQGQMRAEARRDIALLPPFWATLGVALCLSGMWALRKKLHLD